MGFASSSTASKGDRPDIPHGVQIGDFIVGRFVQSDWSRYFPWEDWDHAAMITKTEPLTIIESSGIILQRENVQKQKQEIREGVVEYEFQQPRIVINIDQSQNLRGNLWQNDDLIAMLWLRPTFPMPLRAMDHWSIPWRKRAVISEHEARKRAVAYARSQLGEPHNIWISKRNTKEWYCSYLIYKAYSRTVTNMYLETYPPTIVNTLPFGHVTPEDLVQSNRSESFHEWHKTDSPA